MDDSSLPKPADLIGYRGGVPMYQCRWDGYGTIWSFVCLGGYMHQYAPVAGYYEAHCKGDATTGGYILVKPPGPVPDLPAGGIGCLRTAGQLGRTETRIKKLESVRNVDVI